MSQTSPWVVVRRVLVVLPVLPWLLAYGVGGVAALVRAVASLARGERVVDIGYDENVATWVLLGSGVWLVLGFAVLLAAAVMLFLGRRDARLWVPVVATALVLLTSSVGWIVSMRLGSGESATIWSILCWPTAAVSALPAGRLLERATGRTF